MPCPFFIYKILDDLNSHQVLFFYKFDYQLFYIWVPKNSHNDESYENHAYQSSWLTVVTFVWSTVYSAKKREKKEYLIICAFCIKVKIISHKLPHRGCNAL